MESRTSIQLCVASRQSMDRSDGTRWWFHLKKRLENEMLYLISTSIIHIIVGWFTRVGEEMWKIFKFYDCSSTWELFFEWNMVKISVSVNWSLRHCQNEICNDSISMMHDLQFARNSNSHKFTENLKEGHEISVVWECLFSWKQLTFEFTLIAVSRWLRWFFASRSSSNLLSCSHGLRRGRLRTS